MRNKKRIKNIMDHSRNMYILHRCNNHEGAHQQHMEYGLTNRKIPTVLPGTTGNASRPVAESTFVQTLMEL